MKLVGTRKDCYQRRQPTHCSDQLSLHDCFLHQHLRRRLHRDHHRLLRLWHRSHLLVRPNLVHLQQAWTFLDFHLGGMFGCFVFDLVLEQKGMLDLFFLSSFEVVVEDLVFSFL